MQSSFFATFAPTLKVSETLILCKSCPIKYIQQIESPSKLLGFLRSLPRIPLSGKDAKYIHGFFSLTLDYKSEASTQLPRMSGLCPEMLINVDPSFLSAG
jgi:hypothetical protein